MPENALESLNSEIGTGEDNRSTSSTADYVHYLNPSYPTTGTLRLVGTISDSSGNYLKTLTSNEFEIGNSSFDEE